MKFEMKKVWLTPTKCRMVAGLIRVVDPPDSASAGHVARERLMVAIVIGPDSGGSEVAIETLVPPTKNLRKKPHASLIPPTRRRNSLFEDRMTRQTVTVLPSPTKQTFKGILTPRMKNGIWTGCFTYVKTAAVNIDAIDNFTYLIALPDNERMANKVTVYLTTNCMPKFNPTWEEWILPIKAPTPLYIVESFTDTPVQINVQFPGMDKRRARHCQLEYFPPYASKGLDKFQVVLSNSVANRVIEVAIQHTGGQ